MLCDVGKRSIEQKELDMRKLVAVAVMTAALLGAGAQSSWASGADDVNPHCNSHKAGCTHK